MAVNCGALPESLLESELFGHEKGAFTGAQYRRKGKIEMADGGTLFLDEVGAIDPKTQVDLLRVLETKELTRVGGMRSVKVDFRVICATNEDLKRAVEEGRFREDFFYRINVFTIELPPLRTRRSDIPALARHFLDRFAKQMDNRITGISPEAMDLLTAYDWPGNVRELSNAIERAMVVGTPPDIRPEDLPLRAPQTNASSGRGVAGGNGDDVTSPPCWSTPTGTSRGPPRSSRSTASPCTTRSRSTACAVPGIGNVGVLHIVPIHPGASRDLLPPLAAKLAEVFGLQTTSHLPSFDRGVGVRFFAGAIQLPHSVGPIVARQAPERHAHPGRHGSGSLYSRAHLRLRRSAARWAGGRGFDLSPGQSDLRPARRTATSSSNAFARRRSTSWATPTT